MILRVISENKNVLSATFLFKVIVFGFVGSIRFNKQKIKGRHIYFLKVDVDNIFELIFVVVINWHVTRSPGHRI